MEKARLCVDPGYLEWAGVAVFKKAMRFFVSVVIASDCSLRHFEIPCTGASL